MTKLQLFDLETQFIVKHFKAARDEDLAKAMGLTHAQVVNRRIMRGCHYPENRRYWVKERAGTQIPLATLKRLWAAELKSASDVTPSAPVVFPTQAQQKLRLCVTEGCGEKFRAEKNFQYCPKCRLARQALPHRPQQAAPGLDLVVDSPSTRKDEPVPPVCFIHCRWSDQPGGQIAREWTGTLAEAEIIARQLNISGRPALLVDAQGRPI